MKTSTELVTYFMAMSFEERERFLIIFKKIYDASRLASKQISQENRARLKEIND